MKLVIKFIAAMLIGYAISRTEQPIHKLERGIAGLDGVSDWYLIMRYVIGTGALACALIIMLHDDDNLKCLLDECGDSKTRLDKLLYTVGTAFLNGAVGVGSGVGLGFLQNSWNEFDGRG